MNSAIAQVYKTVIFETRLPFRRFWVVVEELRRSENTLLAIMFYLYRKTCRRYVQQIDDVTDAFRNWLFYKII